MENNQFIGVSRGGKNTKIHAVVDGLGNPVRFILSGGQVNDCKVAIPLPLNIDIANSNILADRAYGTNEILDYISVNNAKSVIPSKSNAVEQRKID